MSGRWHTCPCGESRHLTFSEFLSHLFRCEIAQAATDPQLLADLAEIAEGAELPNSFRLPVSELGQ